MGNLLLITFPLGDRIDFGPSFSIVCYVEKNRRALNAKLDY